MAIRWQLLAMSLLAMAQTAFAQGDAGPRPSELIAAPDANGPTPVAPVLQPQSQPQLQAPPGAAPSTSAPTSTPLSSFAPPPGYIPPAGFVPMPPPAAGYSSLPVPTPPPFVPQPPGSSPSSSYVPTPYAPPSQSSLSTPYSPSPSTPSLSAPYAPSSPSYVPAPYVPPSPAVAPAIVTSSTDYWTDRLWFTTDYLMWWTKSGSSPPLVTSGSTFDFNPGALGQHGTQVLFGGTLDPGMFSGLRLNGGFWITDHLGIDASYFSLFQNSISFNAPADQNGFPLVARPVYYSLSGNESSYVDSYPGIATGGSSAMFSSKLSGLELNLAIKAVRDGGLSVDGFVGYRQLNLNENITVQDSIAALQAGYLTFMNQPADPPNSLLDFDSFTTSSNFYGGQFGGRMNWNFDRFNFNILGKLAMGVSQQIATINGGTTLITPGAASVTVPGGILTQSTNIGRYVSDQFAIVPELGLNFGYQLTPWMQFKFGYTFLFWSSVARPGQQIDRRVNGNNVATDANFGGSGGPATPGFSFVHSNYWAQGLNLGLEFRR